MNNTHIINRISVCTAMLFFSHVAQGDGRAVKVRSAADVSPAEKQAVIDRAKELRSKWRPWAFEHRVELKRMLSAKASDTQAFETVWQALPISPAKAGFTLQELMGTGNPRRIGFAWAPLSKIRIQAKNKDAKPIKPETQRVLNTIELSHIDQRLDDFRIKRDIVIALTIKGESWIGLWASGRITERRSTTAAERPAMYKRVKAEGRSMRLSDIFTPYREIAPPFDFLPSQPK